MLTTNDATNKIGSINQECFVTEGVNDHIAITTLEIKSYQDYLILLPVCADWEISQSTLELNNTHSFVSDILAVTSVTLGFFATGALTCYQ